MKQALFSALAVGFLAAPNATPVDCGGTYVSFLERVDQRAQAFVLELALDDENDLQTGPREASGCTRRRASIHNPSRS